MNNKGFTLIELLAVIVLLGVVAAIAIPGIGNLNNTIKNNMLDKKIDIIEEAATLYGDDNRNVIIESTTHYNGAPCKSYIVSDFVPAYVDKDNENNCLTRNATGNGCITDPRNDKNFLDKVEVIIYYKNKRISAKMDMDNNLTCS